MPGPKHSAEQAFEIVFMMTEKACPELPISGQANTGNGYSEQRPAPQCCLATTICMPPSLGRLGCVFLSGNQIKTAAQFSSI